jgi:hypothetical protein
VPTCRRKDQPEVAILHPATKITRSILGDRAGWLSRLRRKRQIIAHPSSVIAHLSSLSLIPNPNREPSNPESRIPNSEPLALSNHVAVFAVRQQHGRPDRAMTPDC